MKTIVAIQHRHATAFTLVELLVALTIAAILAAVAFPSYRQHVVRSNRSAAQAQMMEIAVREQQFFMANRQYADHETLNYTLPAEVDQHYDWEIAVGTDDVPSFVITFSPTGSQASDGDLTLDNQGNKSPASKWK